MRRVGRSGRPTRRCRSSGFRGTTASCTPTGLRSWLAGGRPEAAPTGNYLLFHVNFGVPEEYAEDHLPGALYLDTNQLENPVDWNRRTPEEIDAAVRALEITSDTTVILYGRDTEGDANEKWPGRRAGQIAATRGDDPVLRRRRRRSSARRRLRRLGSGGQRGRDHSPAADAGAVVRSADPPAPRRHRGHRGGETDPVRSGQRRPRQRQGLE